MNVKLPAWSVRNPLGTIALFISLIYGVSALLLGTTVASLAPWNQTILTIFVVLFPCAVLAVFTWLVAVHHQKLYGPGDYRTDEGFLQAAGQSSPEEVGARLQKELSEDSDTASPNIEGAQPPSDGGHPEAVEPTENPMNRNRLIQRAYVAESLVFQELQDKLSGTVMRNVSLPAKTKPFRVDGVIYAPEGEYIVETILVRNKASIEGRLRRSVSRLKAIAEAFPTKRLIFAVVGDGVPANGEVLSKVGSFSHGIPDIATFFFDLHELELKYGFPSGAEEPGDA